MFNRVPEGANLGIYVRELLLPRIEQNKIFGPISSLGLDSTDFAWERTFGRQLHYEIFPVVVHNPTRSYFTFERGIEPMQRQPAACLSVIAPGVNFAEEERTYPGLALQVADCILWLAAVKLQADEPDLWRMSAQQRAAVNAGAIQQNTPLSPVEQAAAKSATNEIREFLLGITEQDQASKQEIISRLDYLAKASERLGKKDYINTVIGVLFGMAVQYAGGQAAVFFHFAVGQIANAIATSIPDLAQKLLQ